MNARHLAGRGPRLTVFVTSAVTALLGACAPAPSGNLDRISPPAGLPMLSLLGEFTRPAGASYPGIADSKRFGSLSGLVHDMNTGQWLSVIDDRDGTRVAWLSIAAAGGRLEVAPTRMQYLQAGPGIDHRIATQADLEAIVALPDGTFLMSEEGHITKDGVWPPAILQVTHDGVVTGVVSYPQEFQISPDGKTGLRQNQGFESLTRTPRGRLIAGLEQPLAQHAITSFARGGEGRLVEFEASGLTWRAGRQWRYPLSPTPALDGFPNVCGEGENGLVDLLALTETTLIALERACLQSAGGTAASAIQLFSVVLSDGAATKSLLLNLSTLTPRLSPALVRLENFEALAFGPTVNGGRTLLVMSDDNFRATQKTSFLLFGMR